MVEKVLEVDVNPYHTEYRDTSESENLIGKAPCFRGLLNLLKRNKVKFFAHLLSSQLISFLR